MNKVLNRIYLINGLDCIFVTTQKDIMGKP